MHSQNDYKARVDLLLQLHYTLEIEIKYILFYEELKISVTDFILHFTQVNNWSPAFTGLSSLPLFNAGMSFNLLYTSKLMSFQFLQLLGSSNQMRLGSCSCWENLLRMNDCDIKTTSNSKMLCTSDTPKKIHDWGNLLSQFNSIQFTSVTFSSLLFI